MEYGRFSLVANSQALGAAFAVSGLSKAALARKTGYSTSLIFKAFAGGKIAEVAARRISEALCVSAESIFPGFEVAEAQVSFDLLTQEEREEKAHAFLPDLEKECQWVARQYKQDFSEVYSAALVAFAEALLRCRRENAHRAYFMACAKYSAIGIIKQRMKVKALSLDALCDEGFDCISDHQNVEIIVEQRERLKASIIHWIRDGGN